MAPAKNICAPLGTLSTFFYNPVFQVSTAKNEINLFNNHILIVAPVTFAPAGAMTPSAEFLFPFEWYRNVLLNMLLFTFTNFILQDGTFPRFSSIAAMHSDLVAIGTNGQLYSWKWNDFEPYKHPEVRSCQSLYHLHFFFNGKASPFCLKLLS